jgi:cyclomaltodextrinase
MNLIDSHDTVRFLTQVGGDVKRLELAALFGMTYVGAPHIYYGDEVGLEGGKDPDCRRPFPWNWKDDSTRVAIHDRYRSLAHLRNDHEALRTGSFHTYYTHGMVYGYVRSDDRETFLVTLNAGRQPAEMPVDLAAWGGRVRATDMLSGATENWDEGSVVKLDGEAGRVFRIERAAGSSKKK